MSKLVDRTEYVVHATTQPRPAEPPVILDPYAQQKHENYLLMLADERRTLRQIVAVVISAAMLAWWAW